ncbi:hypothetical protein MsAg5_04240 [Methanosarcinaceae archaeon Ag5]|uniref:ABC-2 transporter permease n=1 Tax=Methanolapillus africanus TaxID=3028297 RepID=A0AAE4MI23_9EURY|nr:hypothetical protein [Methanosarcinaceae archaeon Ag5]
MNKILSVARLDFYTIKPYQKSLFGMVLIWLVLFLVFRSIGMIAAILMISLTLFATYPFSIGERYGLDTLYSTLSVKRKHVVIGRYAFAFLIELIGTIVVLILAVLPIFNAWEDITISEFLVVICILYAICALVIAAQYPIFFKYGYTKSKLFAYLPLMLIFLASTSIPLLIEFSNLDPATLFDIAASNIYLIGIGFVVVGLVLQVLSCLLSCKLYEKRDL